MNNVLTERRSQVFLKGKDLHDLRCGKASAAGSVSQRACVFCGSRVVLYPIADALHIVHGPIGCAVYTWDIRGSLSSGPQLHRNSFSTDLQEQDIIRGGEPKLLASLRELIDRYRPRAAFVYTTCIVGLIGDDVQAVCRVISAEKGIPVIPVHSEGFKGTKKDGYRAACEALFELIGTGDITGLPKHSINILGEFNIAGETWIIRRYFERMGINVVSTMTGDGRVDDIRKAHGAALNVVQCSGSMVHLANLMKDRFGVPFKRVSYFGIEDMSAALYEVAAFFKDPELERKTEELVREEVTRVMPSIREYRERLAGKRAAIYVGGAFKAFSLVRALRMLGMQTVVVGSQTGNAEDYNQLKELCDEGTIIVDDSNPVELAHFISDKNVDLFIGGVKERPIAHKLGIGFCDHNHERKIPLAGFEGMLYFAREVHASVTSPVWSAVRGNQAGAFPTIGAETSKLLKVMDLSSPVSQGVGGGHRRNEKKPVIFQSLGKTAAVSEYDFSTTRNACKLCTPLGACLAFRGVEGAIPFLHGSQGCATYIRRYVISHFREPIDIASSSFNEANAVFGGGENLMKGLDNVTSQYHPALIGIATTCLSETIGEDVPGLLREYRKARIGHELPELVHVSTPSYRETHSAGFHDTVRALLETLAKEKGSSTDRVLVLPGMVSPADMRYLKEVFKDFGLPLTLLADYSETLDAPLWTDYQGLPQGGTPVDEIRHAGGAVAAIQFGQALASRHAGADLLSERFGTAVFKQGWPVGLRATDRFFQTLEQLSGHETPALHAAERGRLMDSLVDGHKYVFGLKAAIYGEDDLVLALAGFCAEIGIEPVICATGSRSGHLKKWLGEIAGDGAARAKAIEGADFAEITAAVAELKPDLLIGNSKGFSAAQAGGVPLIRVGFPVHDRFGSQRIRHLGYRGAQDLFDRIVNAVIEGRQESSGRGYSYL